MGPTNCPLVCPDRGLAAVVAGYQTQILHEYDSCCFSPHGRHDQMLAYEKRIRAELQADDRSGGGGKHGWFTCAADNHVKHEVCAQDKRIISSVVSSPPGPGASAWQQIPCDIM